MRHVVRVTTSLGGEVVQVTGGDKGTVALLTFGAPTSSPDDATRAVAAAVRLVRALPTASAGVTTGMAFAGRIGDERPLGLHRDRRPGEPRGTADAGGRARRRARRRDHGRSRRDGVPLRWLVRGRRQGQGGRRPGGHRGRTTRVGLAGEPARDRWADARTSGRAPRSRSRVDRATRGCAAPHRSGRARDREVTVRSGGRRAGGSAWVAGDRGRVRRPRRTRAVRGLAPGARCGAERRCVRAGSGAHCARARRRGARAAAGAPARSHPGRHRALGSLRGREPARGRGRPRGTRARIGGARDASRDRAGRLAMGRRARRNDCSGPCRVAPSHPRSRSC